MTRFPIVLTITSFLLVGCTSQPSSHNDSPSQVAEVSPDSIHIVFLTRDGCANTPVLLANLEAAVGSLDPPVDYKVVNQGPLPTTDARVGYATPTILYDNRDLFGLPQPIPPFPAPS